MRSEYTINLSPLVNKTVAFRFNGADLRFDLSHALFSSFDVDQGTRMLLKAVARDEALASAKHVLDAGCGTGVIGLCVAKAFVQAEVVMRDRDLLAVAFSERNQVQNRIAGVKPWTDPASGRVRQAVAAPAAFAGLLADGCEGGPYDYILSNLPAKAGAPVLEAFFRRCTTGRLRPVNDTSLPAGKSGPGTSSVHGTTTEQGVKSEPATMSAFAGILAPGGRVAVVIVNTLADHAAIWIADAGLEILKSEKGGGHSVFVARRPMDTVNAGIAGQDGSVPTFSLPGDPALADLGLYVRREGPVTVGKREFVSRGFWGLPDFDTVNHATDLAAEVMNRCLSGSLIRDCVFVNPGVGQLALWTSRVFGPRTIALASRDSLSLLASRDNLLRLSRGDVVCPIASSLDLEDFEAAATDLLVWNPDIIPDYDWIEPIWSVAGKICKTGACLVLVSTPTELVRLEKRKPALWRLLADRRKKGNAVMVFRRE